MLAEHKVRILDQQKIARNVYYIQLTRTGDFIPGQLLALTEQPGEAIRYYSIASGQNDDYWGILYDRVDEGRLTPRISEMKPGDSLFVSPPFGDFLPQSSPMVWIATGTGIAPFYSMLRSGLADRDTILIYGARDKEGFYFHESFKEVMGDRYVPCSSRALREGFFPGRLSLYLKEEFSFPNSFYYLCGSSSMVVDIRDLLVSRGVDYNRIISEIYF